VADQTVPGVEALLARAVEGVGGEPRAGQLAMAHAVTATMRGVGHLLVQAGTGTGKSLAYLVPALHHTTSDDADDAPVVVATATIALQRQLIERDLPRLVESIGAELPRTPTFAILKGRRNYLCLQRFNAGPEDEQAELFDGESAQGKAPSPTSSLGLVMVRVGDWAARTQTGDRDELVPGVSERAWGQVAVSARECVGATNCRFGAECFAERARARAMRSDVIVTNHALLAIDAIGEGSVLPEHDIVVIDEAHELVDRVTGAATEELTGAIVERAAARCRRVAADEAARLDEAAAALSDVASHLPEGRLLPLPAALAESLELVRDAARAVLGVLSSSDVKTGGEPDADGRRKQAYAGVEAVFDTVTRMLASSEHDVTWVASEERRGAVLRVAPLQVGGLLHDALFSQRTAVLTSATLTLGGRFEPVAAHLGLAAGEWEGLDVGSPFEHRKQGILYVARHLPPPGRDGITDQTLDEIAGLIEAAGGRTLGLFSSMRAASTAAQMLRPKLDVEILCQGDDSTGELVRKFAASPTSCLFGTLSLWQGVDVPGASCQLVIVDRIPFPRPDDPLMAARQRAVAEAGGNGFMAIAASQAALLLAQGAGRLLRSRSDRGVVAVLDSRLETARYGGFLRASMPPFWYTTDPAVVRKSLRALDVAAGGKPKPPEVEQPMLDVG
jgi:ATP-dependent DNA helicase DinG